MSDKVRYRKSFTIIWTSSQENLTDAFKQQICRCFRSLQNLIPELVQFIISLFWLVFIAEQAGLSLTWSETSKILKKCCPRRGSFNHV